MLSLENKSAKTENKRRILINNYLNDFNYFNKNNIKMSKIRKENLYNLIKEKKGKKLNLPKMLYSNLYMGLNIPNISKEKYHTNINSLNKLQTINDDNIPYNNIKFDKEYIEETIKLDSQEEKLNTSHVNKPIIIFDDIFKCIDNLELTERDKKEEKEIENQNNKNDNNEIKINDNNEKESNLNKQFLNTGNSRNNFSLSKDKLRTIYNNNKNNTDNIKMKMSLTTNLSDDSIMQKVLEQRRNYKQILQFNDYGKYKFSRKGLNYPETIPENKLPNYKGNDKKEKIYFNYRKKVSNPNKIYNSLESFDTKFNYELGRISHTYGKEESKGRFIKNPLIDRYQNSIPFYDIYKDIKFVENRYLDKGRYKYKLLPLINAKMRNFDRLGQKIYKMNIQKRNKEMVIKNALNKTNF
jgi:hypothetical protein